MSFKYENGSAQVLQDGTGAAVPAGADVTAINPFDNSAPGGLFFWGDLELVATFGSGTAPTVGKQVEVYLLYAPDGTNYCDASNASPPFNQFVGTFNLKAVSTPQRLLVRGVPLSPFKVRAYLRNQADQSMNAGWLLNFYPYREQ